jgi:uncharacterized protein
MSATSLATRIIDVDSHFYEPTNWLEEEAPDLAAKIPPIPLAEIVAEAVAGDAFFGLPASARPDPMTLFPPEFRSITEKMTEMVASGATTADAMSALGMTADNGEPADRLPFLDQRGIAVQFVLPTMGHLPYKSAMREGLRDLALPALTAYNRWATNRLAGHTDRLIPVILIDLADVEWAIAELKRGRESGSRVFQLRAEPNDDKAFSHPDFDVFWRTACDLEMAVMFHVGAGRPGIPSSYINNGGQLHNFVSMYRLSSYMVPQLALADLILGGVLERHPTLACFVGELGIGWVPSFVDELERMADRSAMFGKPWGMSLRPTEFMQRQVRVAALVAGDTLRPTMDYSPEGVVVFSSDFPHPEGSADALDIFDAQLDGLDVKTRESFFGGAVNEVMKL